MKLSIFKRILTLLVLSPAMLAPECADAQKVKDIRVDSVSIRRHGDYLAVDFCYDLARVKVPSNRAVVLTPRLVNGNDSVDLKSVGIYGRRRYYYYMRNGGGTSPVQKRSLTALRSSPPTSPTISLCLTATG